MIRTEAWTLYQAADTGSGEPPKGELKREIYLFPDITEDEVLAEPIYGCWEGNMAHAIERRPVDICKQRGEARVVIGNAGVVRVLKTGASVTTVNEGDLCLVFCNGVWDELGYAQKIFAYDAPGTVGLLAKRTKLHERQLIRIPENTQYSYQQWAAFSLRYITAWANWKVAYNCLRLQLDEEVCPAPFVCGWGGGVTWAELTLAQFSNCHTAMISSNDERLKLMQGAGITPIDRRQFLNLNFDQEKYLADALFKQAYQQSEEVFLDLIKSYTEGRGISIFIDFIGLPIYRATLKALARPGVLTTAGWKEGMNLTTYRAIECMKWHTHVHTHYARYADGLEAVRFAEERGWMPSMDGEVYQWDNIPQLSEDYIQEKICSYFPIYRVNSL